MSYNPQELLSPSAHHPTSALASARALLIKARRASLRAAVIGATLATSDDAAERIRAAGRLDRFSPSLCHQAENSQTSTSPLPSLRAFDFVETQGGAKIAVGSSYFVFWKEGVCVGEYMCTHRMGWGGHSTVRFEWLF